MLLLPIYLIVIVSVMRNKINAVSNKDLWRENINFFSKTKFKMKSQRKKNICSSSGIYNKDLVAQATGEINKIFDTIKNKKAILKVNSVIQKQKSRLNKRKKKDNVIKENYNKESDLKSNNIKPVRYLSDGLPVYRLEDINLGK